MKVIFYNIGYMHHYKGITEEDSIISGHGFVQENNDGNEKYNFLPLAINGKEYCLGFVEPGHSKGGYKENAQQNHIHIERLVNSNKCIESLDEVLVIWCASVPKQKGSVVVGWYKDATIYDRLQKAENLLIGVRDYNVIAAKENCVNLPIEERMKEEWKVPRSRMSIEGFGFGQSSVWYADGKNARDYVNRIVNQINEYNGENLL